MARPIKHDAATREALLDAAELLLLHAGAESITVRAVADSIDVSTRAVYTAFGSMPTLFGALAARGFDHLTELVTASPISDEPAADLVGVGRAFRRFALERPHLFRITFERVRADIYLQPEAAPALGRAHAALVAFVERARADGFAPSHSADEVVFMFHSICCGLASNELSSQPPPVGVEFWRIVSGADLAALWDSTLSAFVDGLRPAGRRARSGRTARATGSTSSR